MRGERIVLGKQTIQGFAVELARLCIGAEVRDVVAALLEILITSRTLLPVPALLVAPSLPLVDPDEGLHASIAQEMLERGDWIVPRMLDKPFLDKPILYFWAIAVSLKTFGMSEAAVRLPGLLFGALGTLTTAALAWRLLGRRTGLIAGMFYATMILPLALVQLPAHDVALVPLVNLALICFWESECCGGKKGIAPICAQHPVGRSGKWGLWPFSRDWAWSAAAGMVLGLTILTKGLAGVAMVGIAFGGCLIVSRRLQRIHYYRAALALTLAAIIGSSWYLAVEHAHPGYLRYYFFRRHVLGFLTDSQPHGGAPWWYYIPFLAVGGIPWIAYLPVLVQDSLDRKRDATPPLTDARGNRPLLLLACWAIGCTLFLTFCRSKLLTYIWPVFPAIAILAAVVWTRKIEDGLTDAAKALDGTNRVVHLLAGSARTAGRAGHCATCCRCSSLSWHGRWGSHRRRRPLRRFAVGGLAGTA